MYYHKLTDLPKNLDEARNIVEQVQRLNDILADMRILCSWYGGDMLDPAGAPVDTLKNVMRPATVEVLEQARQVLLARAKDLLSYTTGALEEYAA